jgi:hypothetical protein
MHAEEIVSRVVETCLKGLHRKQAKALKRAVQGAVRGGTVTLSSVALWLPGETAYRHRCKSVDRLLGKPSLHREREGVYAALAKRWLQGVRTLLVVVDWSDLTPDQSWQWLRASVVVEGRSVTLFEEAHAQKMYTNPEVHRRFLLRLARILPAGCEPIIMTDAGFRAIWFRQVEQLGWRFIGRVRNRDLAWLAATEQWCPVKSLYAEAKTGRVVDLGRGKLTCARRVEARFVVYRQRPRGRHRRTALKARSAQRGSLKHGRTAREPWLLASSPELGHLEAQTIASMYAQRMRIEQSFRDCKNHRLGLGLATSRSRGQVRLDMLLLIAHLAAFALRLIGEMVADDRQLVLDLAPPARDAASVVTLALRARLGDRLDRVRFVARRAFWKLREQAQAAPYLSCLPAR